ncbi:MAG: efflux RND transporter permease subunit [Alphaproteobacteria bacterium]|jgi:multidrug efflux pump subunit AcrB|nr:efflux RND transporter permease subunit [Alphaproteobacteria bacterium]
MKRDLLGLFVRHRTAANLLMIFMIIIGIVALGRLNTQFFPSFSVDWVTVTVDWPGASAEDVDANIVGVIEPELRFIDSVKRVVSKSAEGFGILSVEFEAGADLQTGLSNVETAVTSITTLPEDSDRPTVTRIYSYETIARLVVSGPFSESSLKAVAKGLREGLLATGIDKVDLFGARDEEIWVEASAATLRQLDLTPGEISDLIARSSIDLPSGIVPGASEKQIRSLGLARTVESIGEIEIRALPGGQRTVLRDIARITDAFDENDAEAVRLGQHAVELHVRRALGSDALEQSALLDTFMEEVRPTLAPSIRLERYGDAAAMIEDRINLLLRNGASGLVLVVAVLFIFLSGRVAFWVAVSIPVTLFATLGIMLLLGQSINMVSLFAIIMALGIIVDDSIVVAEHAVTRRGMGDDPTTAAETGAKRMLAPVLAASLTTIAAFVPLLLISDIMGQIIAAIPMVIIAIILASLVECFFILPGHLRGALKSDPAAENRFARWFNPRFEAFRDGLFDRLVRGCLRWRYLTLSVGVGLIILVFGLMAGGRLDFVFFPSPESDTVYANVVFAEGTERAQTREMVQELERALAKAEAQLTNGEGGLVAMSLAQIGVPVGRSDSLFAGSGDHVAGVRVELIPSDTRDIRTPVFVEAWRAAVRQMPGMDIFSVVEQQSGPPGREIDIRVTGDDLKALKRAADDVVALLQRFPGVSDVEDDLPHGKLEAIMEVTSRGRALGFTTSSVGRQVRNAFEGAIAKRFARGDEEVTVRVRYPREALTEADLRRLYLVSPNGVEVPLAEVVEFREARGFAQIKREDGLRMVSVTGEIDENITTTDEVLGAIREAGLAEIARRHNVDIGFKGKAEEQATTLADMRTGGIVGLAAIYLILAAIFSSYLTPVFVMAVIPFGIVGAILGHLVLGYDLTILSMVGLLGLSGIVVNDSIILVRAVQDRLVAGEALVEALAGGARDRLRAVILTSVTTIFGLLPLLFETSLQAQFLKPMAVSIVFGLLGATFIVLILVPTLLAIKGDIGVLFRSKQARREAGGAGAD